MPFENIAQQHWRFAGVQIAAQRLMMGLYSQADTSVARTHATALCLLVLLSCIHLLLCLPSVLQSACDAAAAAHL
jgi:hypothetical protein